MVICALFLLLLLRKFCRYYLGMTEKKHIERLFFCIGNFDPFSLKIGLILPHARFMIVYSPLLHVFIGFFFKKKKLKEKMQKFSFLFSAFQILHAFLPHISVHCTLIDYAYI
jgi:hypothetical protein